MKLPRDVSGPELANALAAFGYHVTRQTGSHIRLSTMDRGEHHITIPSHSELRLGTLSAILGDVAEHFGIAKEVVAKRIFTR